MADTPKAPAPVVVSTLAVIVTAAVGLSLAVITPAVGPLRWLPYAAGLIGGAVLGWATSRLSQGALSQARWSGFIALTFVVGLGIGSRFAYGVTHFTGVCIATMAIAYKVLGGRVR